MKFDGIGAGVVARIMARDNADMERDAVARLAPDEQQAVLEIGFGPGVGVELLAARAAFVAGVDPSGVMLRVASKRNRAAIRAGRVELFERPAHQLPWPDARFDGCIAVNSVQLWDPMADSVAAVARVLKPGAALVTLTHDWAARRHAASVEAWVEGLSSELTRHDMVDVAVWHGVAKSGGTVGVSARRALTIPTDER